MNNECTSCGFSIDFCVCESRLVKRVSRPYNIYQTDQLLKQRNKLIKSIANDDYGLSEDEATLILMYFQWNKEDFDLLWWDDPEGIREKCGLDISASNKNILSKMNIPESSKFCLVCYAEEDLFALSCGHHLCKYCWEDYLKLKTEDFLVTLSTTCPQEKCPLVVPERIFFKYLENIQKH